MGTCGNHSRPTSRHRHLVDAVVHKSLRMKVLWNISVKSGLLPSQGKKTKLNLKNSHHQTWNKEKIPPFAAPQKTSARKEVSRGVLLSSYGSSRQQWHRDSEHLFQTQLPLHAMTIFTPLVEEQPSLPTPKKKQKQVCGI